MKATFNRITDAEYVKTFGFLCTPQNRYGLMYTVSAKPIAYTSRGVKHSSTTICIEVKKDKLKTAWGV